MWASTTTHDDRGTPASVCQPWCQTYCRAQASTGTHSFARAGLQDLEWDVWLGIMENVGPNTPVTWPLVHKTPKTSLPLLAGLSKDVFMFYETEPWCSRMVVAAKADKTPRCMVDLKHLNQHSIWQTHHVKSIFHLADRVPQHTIKTVTGAWNR